MGILFALEVGALFIVVTAPLVFVAVFLTVGKRMFTRAFWRYSSSPSLPTDVVDDLAKPIGRFVRWLARAVLWVLKWVVAIAIVLGVLYGVVWIIHAMWRAT